MYVTERTTFDHRRLFLVAPDQGQSRAGIAPLFRQKTIENVGDPAYARCSPRQ
jgi:hypothetical protein